MTGDAGVMLLVIRRVDETLAGGHRCCMTARTLAVQGNIAGGLMIDVVVRPDTAGMTGGTDVRTAFMTGSRTDQCVRPCVMAGCTAIMDLGVAAACKGHGRIGMTYRAA